MSEILSTVGTVLGLAFVVAVYAVVLSMVWDAITEGDDGCV